MKKILLIIIAVFSLNVAFGQLASWQLTSNGNPNGVSANVSAGNFSRGSGINSISYGSKGAYANNWWMNSSGPGTNYYFQVSLTPDVGYTINISDINFGERRSGSGIGKYKVEWSINSDFSNYHVIATVNVPDNKAERTGDLSGLNIDVPDGSTIYIRWYGYAAESTGGTWRINDNTLNIQGTVAAAASGPQSPTSLTAACAIEGEIKVTWTKPVGT